MSDMSDLGENMVIKKRILGVMIFASLGLTGCGETRTQELLSMLENSEPIEIDISMSNGAEELQGSLVEWKELTDLTDQESLRMSIDDILGITSCEDSKNGVLYINPETVEWEGNNTLENVFKNQAFVKMLEDTNVTERLEETLVNAYVDLDENTDDMELKLAMLNAYFNIFPDNKESTEFDGDACLTRAQFMSGIAKAHLPAEDALTASEDVIEQLGDTEYTVYAELVSDMAYLDLESKSLNDKNFNELITRAEVAYIIANIYYADELANIDTSGKNTVYRDVRNAGNMSQETSTMEQYKAANMKYMLEHSWKGLDEELYKALVVCYNHNVFGSESKSRWDEPITKFEALDALVNVYTDIGTTVDNLYGKNQKVDVTEETKFSELNDGIIYTLDGNEYVKSDFENAGSLWYLKQTGHIPYVSYESWIGTINTTVCPFDEWLRLSATERKETLSQHMYDTAKNHISWSGADEELNALDADERLWLYMIYNNEVNEYEFNTCKEFYEGLYGADTIEEARLSVATSVINVSTIYNAVLEQDIMSEEETRWQNQVVALEEREYQQYLASIQNASNNSSTTTNNNSGNQTVYKNELKNVGDIIMDPYWGEPVVMCYAYLNHGDYEQGIVTRTMTTVITFADGGHYIISYTEDDDNFYVTYNDGSTGVIKKVSELKPSGLRLG